MKYTIRLGNSNWRGTFSQIVRWSKEECYNEFQENRQSAAKLWLLSDEGRNAMYEALSNTP